MIIKNYFIKNTIKKIIAPFYPSYTFQKKRYDYFKKILPQFLGDANINKTNKRLLVFGMVDCDLTELMYAKALQEVGYETFVVTSSYNPYLDKIIKLFNISNVCYIDKYDNTVDKCLIKTEAAAYLKKCNSHLDLLSLSKNGINFGKYTVSSVIRKTRSSGFDIKDPTIQTEIEKGLEESLSALYSVHKIIEEIKPDLFFAIERGYTPFGQFFDICLNKGINVIQRCGSHKSGYEILKRYSSPEMSTQHHHSLSRDSLNFVKKMEWNKGKWDKLYNELKSTYVSGDWFSEVGTQFNKKLYSTDEIKQKLGLDPNKKTAVIFPHMFWDATFFWGTDLFADYYDWFVNVLKVASKNKELNWIVKVHPANVVKAKRDNYKGEHKELTAIYETLGHIPDHIKIIPPESDINTFSLFSVMDYCLTVRGTIGIESAIMGINVITAGTGRYDRLGFTHDFDTREAYLDFIKNLHEVRPMSDDKTELARRYAYGIFILRPIHLDILEHGYNQDDKASMKFKPLFKSKEEFERSSFVRTFREYISSGREDYLEEK